MECSLIHKQLQPFLGDLLSEAERRLFLAHLEGCARCKSYVRSIGDLSNQVWRLGDVPVPADFKATVLFELNRPAPSPAPSGVPASPQGGASKKYALIGVVFASLAAAAVFVWSSHGSGKFSAAHPDSPPSPPAASTSAPPVSAAPAPEPPSAAPEPPVAVMAAEKPAAPAVEPKAAPSLSQPLHWHLTYISNPDHRAEAEKRKQGLVELRALRGKAEALKTEIKRLEDARQHDLGQAYSEDGVKERAAEKAERDASLAALLQEIPRLDAEIKRAEDENARIERDWNRESDEKKRRDAQTRAKILDTLVVFEAKFRYQGEGFFVFSIDAEKSDRVLENILPIFQQSGEFHDFSGAAAGPSGREQCVAIYLDQDGADLHWHAAAAPAQKVKLFEAVRELGGSQEYESEGLAVFSVPRTALKELGVRAKVMRIAVTEFGHPDVDGAPLSNTPVKLSVYFSK